VNKKSRDEQELTLVDHYRVREEELRATRDEHNEKARRRIKELSAVNEDLDKKISALEARRLALEAEYLKIKSESEKKIEAKIAEASITEDDLAEGRVSMAEFMAAGKSRETVVSEARLEAEVEMERPRKAIRKINAELLLLKRDRAKNSLDIGVASHDAADSFYRSLKGMIAELDLRGVSGLSTAYLRNVFKDLEQNWLLSRGFPQVKIWRDLPSLTAIEALIFDPVIAEEHIGSFLEMIDGLRGKEFSRITVYYSRSETPGRIAGDFWHTLIE
jgi:hypothetical protein